MPFTADVGRYGSQPLPISQIDCDKTMLLRQPSSKPLKPEAIRRICRKRKPGFKKTRPELTREALPLTRPPPADRRKDRRLAGPSRPSEVMTAPLRPQRFDRRIELVTRSCQSAWARRRIPRRDRHHAFAAPARDRRGTILPHDRGDRHLGALRLRRRNRA